ncbi:hypothetical protein B0H17DRAFT_1145934 [Mycena rosella]|uniref:Uncharacterized protein n=1 Tax=Mycena rosella TaxID=1033263 RepID=A0AAD7CPX5_MYCRO|nr:hypothetical protein B0H17DRAFT_1145934 [Mycena rosella]
MFRVLHTPGPKWPSEIESFNSLLRYLDYKDTIMLAKCLYEVDFHELTYGSYSPDKSGYTLDDTRTTFRHTMFGQLRVLAAPTCTSSAPILHRSSTTFGAMAEATVSSRAETWTSGGPENMWDVWGPWKYWIWACFKARLDLEAIATSRETTLRRYQHEKGQLKSQSSIVYAAPPAEAYVEGKRMADKTYHAKQVVACLTLLRGLALISSLHSAGP